MRESIRPKRQNKEFREKENNTKRQGDLKVLKQQNEKQTFHNGKASNPEHIRELNRKAQNNLRKALQSSNLNQTENFQGQGSLRHPFSKAHSPCSLTLWDFKDPTHYSKRDSVGSRVPGVLSSDLSSMWSAWQD